jgi:hypothetical protein
MVGARIVVEGTGNVGNEPSTRRSLGDDLD